MRNLRSCVIVILGVLVTWAIATPAFAAFPGSNGLLAVQPETGTGIVLVNANGSDEHRICAAGAACAKSGHPAWSPNGHELMFTDPEIKLVYTDGSCLNCSFGAASDPAFQPNGTDVSFTAADETYVDGIDGIRSVPSPTAHTTLTALGSDAVWSSRGELAVVRSGVVWAGYPGRLARIAAASAPSWSPAGRQIAAVQEGWIVVINPASGRGRRLVRGSAPAFSPDGRLIAYVAPDHRLMIADAAGPPRPRGVGDVRAESVDWQPVPSAASPGCQAPVGSTVVARSSAAVITQDTEAVVPGGGDTAPSAIMGCLTATGRERLLDEIGPGSEDGVGALGFAALASPYVALINSSSDPHYGGSSSQVGVYDLSTGSETPFGGEQVSCGQGAFPCTAVLRQVGINSLGWSAAVSWVDAPPGTLSDPLNAIGCSPGGSVCAALSGYANQNGDQVFDSADPSGGASAWRPAPLAASDAAIPQGIACPSSSLCIAVGLADVWTASDGGGWEDSTLSSGPALNAVTCASASLCVATGNAGAVAVSTDPAAGGSSWQIGRPDGDSFLENPVCTPDGTCSVTDRQQVYVSSNPAGGAAAWQTASGAPAYSAESCPTDDFCVLATQGNQIDTATAPGAAAQTETPQPAGTGSLTSISCPTTSFCAAVAADSDVVDISTDPAAGLWSSTTLNASGSLEAIDCTSASACLATDSKGHVLSSSDPTGGASAWASTLVDGNPCDDTTPCSEETIEANTGGGVRTVASSTISGTGPYISGLAWNGDALSWDQNGTQETTTLTS